MLSLVRRAIIRSLLPVSWGRSENRIAESLNRFSHTEADSAWQFLRAADVLESPGHKSAMLLNALEEVNHAALFYEAASKHTERALPYCRSPRKSLINDEAELVGFLAYTYIGEHEVHEEFETYSAVAGNAEARRVFNAISEDEAGHEDSAYKVLVKLAGSQNNLKRTLFRARLRRMYADWIRFSEAIGDVISWLWLSALYYAIAPLVANWCRKYLAEPGAALEPRSFRGGVEAKLNLPLSE